MITIIHNLKYKNSQFLIRFIRKTPLLVSVKQATLLLCRLNAKNEFFLHKYCPKIKKNRYFCTNG